MSQLQICYALCFVAFHSGQSLEDKWGCGYLLYMLPLSSFTLPSFFLACEECQLPIWSHSRSCHVCPVRCMCGFPGWPHHCDSVMSFPTPAPLSSAFIQCVLHLTCFWCRWRFSGVQPPSIMSPPQRWMVQYDKPQTVDSVWHNVCIIPRCSQSLETNNSYTTLKFLFSKLFKISLNVFISDVEPVLGVMAPSRRGLIENISFGEIMEWYSTRLYGHVL